MPISRDEFENGRPEKEYSVEIMQFFFDHRDKAYTEVELIELVAQRRLSNEESARFHEDILGLDFLIGIEKRTINGIDYYAYKEKEE
jgi:hypothetical protein